MILLKKIFDVGLQKSYYSSNPAKLIKNLPIEKTKMQFWTVKEFQKFLTLFEYEEYNIKLLLLYCSILYRIKTWGSSCPNMARHRLFK